MTTLSLLLAASLNENVWRRAFAPETWPTWAAVVVGGAAALIYGLTLRAIRKQTEASHKAANVLINSERAWIMVQVKPIPGISSGIFDGEQIMKDIISHSTSFSVRILCKNDGRTPAWITEKRACIDVVDSLPDKPNWETVDIIQSEPEPVPVGKKSKPKDQGLHCNKGRDFGKMMVVYGIVKYRDIFAADRSTSFGYEVRVDGALERLACYPEYNKNT
jgi:hypothetical protein